VSVHTVKVYRGRRGVVPLFIESALEGGDGLGSGTGRFTSGRGHQSPLNGRLRGLQSLPGLPGEKEYFLLLPGLEPRTAQAVTQLHYKQAISFQTVAPSCGVWANYG